MMRTRIERSAADTIARAHAERLDALLAEVRARCDAGQVEGLEDYVDEERAAAFARFERDLAAAALPASIEECDA